MAEKTIIKAGQLITLERGEYSDYQVMGFFVVLQDLDLFEQLNLCFPCPYDMAPIKVRVNSGDFRAFLIKHGFLLEIEYGEVYVDGYLKDVTFRP